MQTRYLSSPKEGARFENIEDIGKAAEVDLSEDCTTVHGAEVVGVISLESFAVCLVCKAKVEPIATDGNIRCCTKCSMQHKITSCSSQLNAKLVISSGASYLTLNVFGTNVSDIVQQHPPTTQSLRSATQFTFTHSNNVITGVSRPGDS